MIRLMARKHYTDEFRRQAVDLYESTEGATFKGIADDLGLARGTLAQWVSGSVGQCPGYRDHDRLDWPCDNVEQRVSTGQGGVASSQARAARGPGSRPGSGEGQALHRAGDLEVGGEVFRRGDELVSRFQFVADHQDAFEVKQLCMAVQIARSSFYAWQQAAPGRAERAAADAVLAQQIRAVHHHDKTYGAPRVTAELNDGAAPQDRVNHKRIARVMKQHRIAGVRLRRRVRTTIPEASDQKVPDLLKRDFTAPAPNRRYVGDITYLPLASGKNLYLATVIDCYSRRLAGWAIADHMRTDLITTALRDTANTRGTLTGAVFHADHGAQYTSKAF